MRQPTKDQLKDQLALAADEIIRLREREASHDYIGADRSMDNLQFQRALVGGWWRRLLR